MEKWNHGCWCSEFALMFAEGQTKMILQSRKKCSNERNIEKRIGINCQLDSTPVSWWSRNNCRLCIMSLWNRIDSRRSKMIAGRRSDHRGERAELRGGDARRGGSVPQDKQEDEPADTRRWQGAPFVYHQPAHSDPTFPISRARSSTPGEPWESSSTQSRVSGKYLLSFDFYMS